jgi:hypothetical protein
MIFFQPWHKTRNCARSQAASHIVQEAGKKLEKKKKKKKTKCVSLDKPSLIGAGFA